MHETSYHGLYCGHEDYEIDSARTETPKMKMYKAFFTDGGTQIVYASDANGAWTVANKLREVHGMIMLSE